MCQEPDLPNADEDADEPAGNQVEMAADGLKRVVVTGMGITSCLGNDLDTVADNLKNAK